MDVQLFDKDSEHYIEVKGIWKVDNSSDAIILVDKDHEIETFEKKDWKLSQVFTEE